MVIKYFGPNDKRGVFWPPYSAKEKREMQENLSRWHGGPYVAVYPYARAAGPSLPSAAAAAAAATSHRTEATSQSAVEAEKKEAE
jgi:hypothetical protein